MGAAVITRIRPTYWVASRLLLLALAATFAATTVSTIVRGRLTAGSGAAGPRSVEAPRPAAARPVADYIAIARRNLFAAVPPNDSDLGTGPVTVGSSSALRLVGTGRHGGVRFAIVEDTGTKRQLVLRLGEEIGGATVSEIGWRRVVLRRAGREEVLAVTPDAGGTPVDPGLRTTGAIPATTSTDENVKKIGEDRYLVAQAEVDHSMENLSELFTQLRAVPNQDGGKTNGFKVFAIKRGSLFQKIGLENNDVVERVNGVDLNDPTRAMSLFQELQGQSRLTVDIQRGGESRTLTYEIR